MKQIIAIGRSIALLSLMLVLGIGCEENPPFTINTGNIDIDTSQNGNEVTVIKRDTAFMAAAMEPQDHVVLIEEFTGVSCINCPAGHAETKSILEANPNRTVAAIIHAGFLTDPHPNSTEVFVTPETEALYNLLSVVAVPAAAIDRVPFDGEPYLAIVGKSKWAGRVAEQISKTTPVNVYLHKDYNSATRQLNVYVQMRYTESLSDAHNLTVYVIENNISDSQLLPDPVTLEHIIDDEYAHQHVVRDVLTNTAGDALPNGFALNSGAVVVKTFATTLPEHWNADNCHIVAFVHQADSERKVLQTAEIAIIE
jgi:hypothetical protein